MIDYYPTPAETMFDAMFICSDSLGPLHTCTNTQIVPAYSNYYCA